MPEAWAAVFTSEPGLYTERLFRMLRLLGVRLRAEQVR
jgi:hypothetical protein